MKGNRRYIQGYNAQAVVNEQQIVLAAEISTAAGDFSHLRPMIETALHELQDAGVTDKPTVAVADAQYWNEQHMDHVIGEHGIPVLIPPDSGKRKGERPGWTGGRYSFMRRVLTTDLGRETYRKRQQSIEPVFGNTKHNRKIYRFNYRGRSAVRTKAISDDESQPDKAPPPPDRHRESLKPPHGNTSPRRRAATSAPHAPRRPHLSRTPDRPRVYATATAERRSRAHGRERQEARAGPRGR